MPKRHASFSAAVATLIGMVGAALASTAYPDNSIWIAIFPAVAIMIYAIVSVDFRHSALVGFFTGLVFYATQIPWMTTYLGPVPWLALSALEGVIFALGALAINLLWRFGRKNFAPLLTSASLASLWTAREWVSCHVPYGGFPWSRLALSQSNSPLANWVFWGGDSLLSFVIVFITVAAMLTWRNQLRPSQWGSSPVAAVIALLLMVPLLTPTSNLDKATTLDVAAVQGNANAGLFANPVAGSILQNHLSASAPLQQATTKPAVVIWPENAADENPLANADAKWKIAKFTAEVNAPLIFGTITNRGGEIFNSSILWLPNVGAVDWYDKKRPVPFGEYVPDRAFFRMLAPSLVDLIPRGYSFGTRDGIFVLPASNTKLGTMICFEIADDAITRDLVSGGAQMIVVQTNNSDFGTSNESAQQFAIARLRAIESGRAVVNISTVSASAIILPSGKVIDSVPSYKPGMMRDLVPLSSAITPAMAYGNSLEIVNNSVAIAQILLILLLAQRNRRSRTRGGIAK